MFFEKFILKKKTFWAFLVFVMWFHIVSGLTAGTRAQDAILQCLRTHRILIWFRILHLFISQAPQIQYLTNKIHYLPMTLLLLLLRLLCQLMTSAYPYPL